MQITVNGSEHQHGGTGYLTALLAELGIVPERVAIMVNEVIIPKSRRAETLLKEGDRVEILTLVGGG